MSCGDTHRNSVITCNVWVSPQLIHHRNSYITCIHTSSYMYVYIYTSIYGYACLLHLWWFSLFWQPNNHRISCLSHLVLLWRTCSFGVPTLGLHANAQVSLPSCVVSYGYFFFFWFRRWNSGCTWWSSHPLILCGLLFVMLSFSLSRPFLWQLE